MPCENCKRKTMDADARKICLDAQYYKNGECPLCGDYIDDDGDCMYCEFHSALVPKVNKTP